MITELVTVVGLLAGPAATASPPPSECNAYHAIRGKALTPEGVVCVDVGAITDAADDNLTDNWILDESRWVESCYEDEVTITAPFWDKAWCVPVDHISRITHTDALASFAYPPR